MSIHLYLSQSVQAIDEQQLNPFQIFEALHIIER